MAREGVRGSYGVGGCLHITFNRGGPALGEWRRSDNILCRIGDSRWSTLCMNPPFPGDPAKLQIGQEYAIRRNSTAVCQPHSPDVWTKCGLPEVHVFTLCRRKCAVNSQVMNTRETWFTPEGSEELVSNNGNPGAPHRELLHRGFFLLVVGVRQCRSIH